MKQDDRQTAGRAADDHIGQALNHGRLADAGLADEDGLVLATGDGSDVPQRTTGGGTTGGTTGDGSDVSRCITKIGDGSHVCPCHPACRPLDCQVLSGIEVWAYHGVLAQERRTGQRFIVDLAWWLDASPAAATDDLTRTIDYGAVAALVTAVLQQDPVNLIETLAYRVRDAVLARFPMACLAVTIHKPDAPLTVPFADVAFTTAPAGHAPQPVVLSLGSNLEPRTEYLQFAVTALATTPGLTNVRVSPTYETAAQGDLDQPDFLNAVVLAESRLPAPALLRRALDIEALAGRERPAPGTHGPRTLDIDLIAVGAERSDTPELTLPHPRAAQRRFVLAPWLDLDPAASLDGVPLTTLLPGTQDQAVRRWPSVLFTPQPPPALP